VPDHAYLTTSGTGRHRLAERAADQLTPSEDPAVAVAGEFSAAILAPDADHSPFPATTGVITHRY
jgi:hypothetical protein